MRSMPISAPPKRPLVQQSPTRMSPRSDFLLPLIPPLPPGVIVGRCTHTCITSVNLGVRKPIKIGMRSHYASSPTSSCRLHPTHIFFQCPVCKYSFKHDRHPHDENTRRFLREVLDQYDAEQKRLKAQLKAHLKAARRAVDREGDKAKVCFFSSLIDVPHCHSRVPSPCWTVAERPKRDCPVSTTSKASVPFPFLLGPPADLSKRKRGSADAQAKAGTSQNPIYVYPDSVSSPGKRKGDPATSPRARKRRAEAFCDGDVIDID